MKALRYAAYGGLDVLQIDSNAPEPQIRPSQILVKVRAAALNPVDSARRSGYQKENMPPLPITAGGDFSGEVTSVGADVTEFKPGDQVYGQAAPLNGGSGSCAQFVAANADHSARMPRNIDFAQAAALPLVGVSALHALEDLIKLKHGQKILIHGGSGGIGSIAIQLAASLGAKVATTVRSTAMELVRSLGAETVLDFQHEPFEHQLKGYDAVLNASGSPEVTSRSFKVLKRGGVLVSMRDQPDEDLARHFGVTIHRQMTHVNTAHLDRLRELVESATVTVRIDRVFPLDEGRHAFQHMEEDPLTGKVVLLIPE